MLEIQSAIDEYEKRFPRRPEPSAEQALAWRLGKREAGKRLRSSVKEKPSAAIEAQECSRLVWAWEQIRFQLQIWASPKEDLPDRGAVLLPWVRGVLLVGLWSALAVVVAFVFFFGALVGGLK